MRALCLAVVLLSAASCKKEPPPTTVSPIATPAVVTLPGALHAVRCPGVTAVWRGKTPGSGPLEFAIESLAFRFDDGAEVPFAPKGELAFSDWRLDLFSPDCGFVALLDDRFGPYRVAPVANLRAVLEGKAQAMQVAAPADGGAAQVHGDFTWKGAASAHFTASCCGGAEVWQAVLAPKLSLERVFFAPEAPKGIRPAEAGYEVIP